jgi:hypothetical protein
VKCVGYSVQDFRLTCKYQARDALAALAEHAQKYDADGIDVHFFNDSKTASNVRVGMIE